MNKLLATLIAAGFAAGAFAQAPATPAVPATPAAAAKVDAKGISRHSYGSWLHL